MTAIRVYKEQNATFAKFEDIQHRPLQPKEVRIRSLYSSLNYKDALAVTGKGAILKTFPLVPGIDASGTIIESQHPERTVGQTVLVTGCGLGESFDGGYQSEVIVDGDIAIPLPPGWDARTAMSLGTAGFTAALALLRMEQLGQEPAKGPIAISGASGGVGSIATALFASAGYTVVAISAKTELHDWLKKLGAAEVKTPEQLHLGTRPLESARFGGAVDNVGGDLLARLLAHVQLWGNVACIGLAQSAVLHTTVMPLILRGVSLIGVSSNNTPLEMRHHIWKRLSTDWKIQKLDHIVKKEIKLKEVPQAAEEMIARKTFGRLLVRF